MTYKLNVNPLAKPIQQKKWKFEQLLAADIIFEVKYPTWLANPVMVNKTDGGW